MVTLVKPVQVENARSPMPTTGMLFIVGGITAGPPGQVYPVIVTVPPDTVYVKSPDCWAKADDDGNIKPIIDRNVHKQRLQLHQ